MARLGDSHEISDYALVCNGDGTARRYLTLEKRDNGAVASEHISEADSRKSRFAVCAALHYHFAHTLGSAHDICRVDRLIRRNQDKFGGAVLLCHIGGIVCTENIVLYRLATAVLHERNMLVRRRMKYDIWAVFGKDAVQSRPVAHGSYLNREVK